MDIEGLRDLRARFTQLELAPVIADPSIRAYFEQPSLENLEPWTLKPEIPSPGEILGSDSDDCLELHPNNIQEPWSSKECYLEAHYELLREDAVAPLRDAVAYVRQSPCMVDSKAVAIYDKVHFIGITFAQQGLAFRIQFSTQRSEKKISWEYSKRLVSGSVVALSPADDAFQHKCVVAVIAARPLTGVQQQQAPEVDIYFARPEDTEFDPQKEWIMVEAKTGYYEAWRHNMTALQKMNRESFPLAKNICFLEENVSPPQYVQDRPVVDKISVNGMQEGGKIDLLANWPHVPPGELDETQWEALHHILTRSLAIVQGPPGTGKTFISVMALKTILSNRHAGDPPLIVASQTNHALDQLLTHISKFEPEYIRLGSRSGDPDIKKRTLYAIRQSEPGVSIHGSILGSARNRRRSIQQQISETLKAFSSEDSNFPIPASLFVKYKLLTTVQHDSLIRGAKVWIRPGEQDDADPIQAWLGDQGAKFEVHYSTDNFGFPEDEIDPEYEQLKEMEAEYGVEEDDYESLKGDYIRIHEGIQGISDGVTRKTATDISYLSDMWKIPARQRGGVYNSLRSSLKGQILLQLRQLAANYGQICKDLRTGKWERDCVTLQKARVIGVTATGLSKYRGLIASMKPRIVLIEEAAEAIEAPIVAACFESIQHLVLVGDHQQLKGHCAVDELGGEPFNLDVSMFERLVCNGLNYVTLRSQRRMAPEIRSLLTPIYGDLQDHPSVLQRPSVPGMGDIRSYFFCHEWPESSDSLSSKVNETEAEMVAEFYLYLVLNGVATKDITILTFYNGQRKKLLKLLRSKSYLQGQYMKVVTVDSYQGEENQVVILSLVRSGQAGIGFLSIQNRVCVALSRAKSGFFIFGNAKCLASANRLWRQIIQIMGSSGSPQRVANQLRLTCSEHNNIEIKKKPSDWSETNGGCRQPCSHVLECGHKCTLLCHSFSHEQVSCDKSCGQQMPCGHTCRAACAQRRHMCSCECPLGMRFAERSADLEVFSFTDPANEGSMHRSRPPKPFPKAGLPEGDSFLLRSAKTMGQRASPEDLDLLDGGPPVGSGGAHVETTIQQNSAAEAFGG